MATMRNARMLGAVGVVLALVLTACGSTIPQAQQVAANGALNGGLGGAALPSGAHVNDKGQIVKNGKVIGTTSSGINGGGSVSGAGGTTGTGGSSSSGAVTGGSSGAGASGANGPGIIDNTIALGLPNITGITAGNAALGGDAASGIDFKAAWTALLHYQNAHGGIAGRRIIGVFHDIDAVSSEPIPQQEQEACTDWTQDHHVFAALHNPISENFVSCMTKAGAVIDSQGSLDTSWTTTIHPKYPSFIEPDAVDIDRAAGLMVDGLYTQKYFVKGEKLGLVTFDDPRFRYAASHALVPALRRHGLKLDDSYYIKYPAGYSDYGQMSNDASNAALKFKTEGIDHVVFIDSGANAAFFFMQAAEKQSYFPRYGLSSQSGNSALADLLGQTKAQDQLKNARSIGWVPTADTHAADDPDARNPTRVLCLSIMHKNGVTMSSRNAEGLAIGLCDSLWSLKAMVQLSGSVINQSSFIAGAGKLGGRYPPGLVFNTDLSSSRHDGDTEVANMSFFDSCTCFKYTSKPYVP